MESGHRPDPLSRNAKPAETLNASGIPIFDNVPGRLVYVPKFAVFSGLKVASLTRIVCFPI